MPVLHVGQMPVVHAKSRQKFSPELSLNKPSFPTGPFSTLPLTTCKKSRDGCGIGSEPQVHILHDSLVLRSFRVSSACELLVLVLQFRHQTETLASRQPAQDNMFFAINEYRLKNQATTQRRRHGSGDAIPKASLASLRCRCQSIQFLALKIVWSPLKEGRWHC